MAAKKANNKKPVPEPKVFFESIVPRVLAIMKATCLDLKGRYAIVVDGAGTWTLDFPTQRVEPGDANVDVKVTLSRAQFEKLSTGKAELAKWVADGEAACAGDR